MNYLVSFVLLLSGAQAMAQSYARDQQTIEVLHRYLEGHFTEMDLIGRTSTELKNYPHDIEVITQEVHRLAGSGQLDTNSIEKIEHLQLTLNEMIAQHNLAVDQRKYQIRGWTIGLLSARSIYRGLKRPPVEVTVVTNQGTRFYQAPKLLTIAGGVIFMGFIVGPILAYGINYLANDEKLTPVNFGVFLKPSPGAAN